MTEDAIHGMVKFITNAKADIGQGVITYAGHEVENWVTTLMDGIRTAKDYGLHRLAYQLFNRPLFGLKGSFIVVKTTVEEDIGFDYGPKESITEDTRFALTAWNKGYKFGFIDGCMMEKSPFSVSDLIKQRKRWLMGNFHIVWGNTLPLYVKFAYLQMHVGTLFLWVNVLNFICSILFPVPLSKANFLLFVLLSANVLFLTAFGNYMSMRSRRMPMYQKLAICLLSHLIVPVLGFVEAWAAIQGFLQRNTLVFDIVEKEIKDINKNIEHV
ncbi:hypothetical protein DPMN_083222 [Dreissena polymorpha]|uniref:Glycosyltransferase 2-like domain-containing protein n=1 Tax=Dreissena polymorpha TaxID=45954 RepID=A0A9D3Y8G3_DREPO|nr:hypothetical protein DPMN_083222 [Dreissena polymorpha]